MIKLDQYYRIRQAAGIHIHMKADGNVIIQICSMSSQGNKLDISQKNTDLSSINDLKKYLPARLPVALNLSGKGILQKRTDRIEEIGPQTFHQILPNGNYEDFYVQNFMSGEYSFVSLVRKSDADGWLDQLKDMGFNPLMLSLGPFAVESIINQLNIYEQEFQFGGYRIVRNEKGEWTECHSSDGLTSAFPIKLASEKMDEKLTIPYAAGFQLVLSELVEPVKAEAGALTAALQDKLSDNKRKVFSALGLVILFITLVVNFIVYTSLNNTNGELLGRLSTYQQDSHSIALLNEQVKEKEQRLMRLGWDGGINKSTLIDKLAALLPPEVTLQEIAVNPASLDKNHSGKALIFEARKIKIRGVSQRILPVNEWMARMKTQNWVKGVRLENFIYNNELNTGQFIITLNY